MYLIIYISTNMFYLMRKITKYLQKLITFLKLRLTLLQSYFWVGKIYKHFYEYFKTNKQISFK